MAPIMMLVQSWVIVAILAGTDAGWAAQRREHGKLPMEDALKAHRWHMVTGIGLAGAAWMVEPMMLAWLSLAIVGLVLAAPISSLTASQKVGKILRRLGLLIIPEERARPMIGRATSTCRPLHRAIVSTAPDMRGLVADDRRRRLHLALLDAPDEKSGEVDPLEAVTAEKIRQARSLDEAFVYLRPDELAIALAKRALFDSLSMLAPDRPSPAGEGIRPSASGA
jgi:membrane glycosyltransferase